MATHFGVANNCPSKRPETISPPRYSKCYTVRLTGNILVCNLRGIYRCCLESTTQKHKYLNRSPTGEIFRFLDSLMFFILAPPSIQKRTRHVLKKHFIYVNTHYSQVKYFGGVLARNQSNNPFTKFTASSFFLLTILAYICVVLTLVCPSNFDTV